MDFSAVLAVLLSCSGVNLILQEDWQAAKPGHAAGKLAEDANAGMKPGKESLDES